MAYVVPNFLMGQSVQGDFSPIQNALAQYQKAQQFNAKLDQDQSQFEATNALARGRFGMEKARFDEEQARRAQWDAQFANGNPEWTRSLPAGTADILRLSGAGAAPQALNMLAQQPDLQLRRASLAEQIEQRRADAAHKAQMYPLQVKELDLKTRALEQKDPEREFLSNIFGSIQRGAQPQPQGPQPGAPMLQPQSFEGGGDAQLIQTQAGNGPAAPQPDMVDVPGVGRMTKQQAEALRFALAKDRGAVMKDALDADKLGKEARNEIDKKEEKATDGLLRIRNVRASFDPSFLSYGTQAKMKLAEVQAKAGKLDRATQEQLYRFATFRRDAAENINSAIKDNSGATVTDQELRRNLLALPNAGTGIFDGDDPVTFQAKIDRAEETLALGIARTRYLRQRGFTGNVDAAAKQLPIESMRGMINQRAKQIEGELMRANPGMAKPILDQQVTKAIKQEFGI